MKITFIRHAQTEYNSDRVVNGQSDNEGINDIGEQEAYTVADKLQPQDYDIIFSSPLKRAKETAEIINQTLHLPIYYRDSLKERSFGSLEGKQWTEIEDQTDLRFDEEQKLLEIDISPWGGESIIEMRQRVEGFLAELKDKYSEMHPLAVTHTWVIKEMYALYNIEFHGVENCSVHEFEI